MMRHPAGLPEALSRLDRTLVIGILNVTPDSFSDGGLYLDPADAVAHGLALHREGADLVDVGGESTRPGAAPVAESQERERVVAVVRDLVAAGVPVGVDTRHASVAAACLESGALLINDVSGGLADPALQPVVAEAGAPYVLMHNRGDGPARDDLAHYADVVVDVGAELDDALARARAAGIDDQRIVVDPGFGFAKAAADNWRLLTALLGHDGEVRPVAERAEAAGWPRGVAQRPMLVGASRKRFLGRLEDGRPRSDDTMSARDRLTAAISAQAARSGAWAVRVHDVAASVAAVREVVGHDRMRA
jgi:dihydropteroate synthase